MSVSLNRKVVLEDKKSSDCALNNSAFIFVISPGSQSGLLYVIIFFKEFMT